MTAPVNLYPTPTVVGDTGATDGGLDLGALFPTVFPEVEQIVWRTVQDACSARTIFPSDGQGLAFPIAFSIPPDISLLKGRDGSYLRQDGTPDPPITVIRGWPAYPGQVPAIGVAESTTSEDAEEDGLAAGFAGDVFAYDADGAVIATCAYYAEPVRVVVVVELIHTNRDERDRLSDQLWRTLQPLKRLIGKSSTQVRKVQISSEKQDLPLDEQPMVMYIALFTLEVNAEALVPSEITLGGAITAIDATVTPIANPSVTPVAPATPITPSTPPEV